MTNELKNQLEAEGYQVWKEIERDFEVITLLKVPESITKALTDLKEQGWHVYFSNKAYLIESFAYRSFYGERVRFQRFIDIDMHSIQDLLDRTAEAIKEYERPPNKEELKRFKVGTWFTYGPQKGSRYKIKKLTNKGLSAITEEGPELDLRDTQVFTEEDMKWMNLE